MGRIVNNLLMVETKVENQIQKYKYVIQEGNFFVTKDTSQTVVTLIATNLRILDSKTSKNELNKRITEIKSQIETCNQTLSKSTILNKLILSQRVNLEAELEFLKECLYQAQK